MSFRVLDLSGFSPAALKDQPAPLLQWVAVADLVIDERYQRGITPAGRRHIQAMAEGFDWKAFGAISCAAVAGGKFAVVDGQHRVHAAALAGLDRVPAVIVPMTPAEQAAAFFAVNSNRKRMDIPDTFRARLAAGDDHAVRADAAVTAAGCRLMPYVPSSPQRKPREVFTHALILGMIQRGADAVVTAGLRAMAASEAGNAPPVGTGERQFRVWDQKVLAVWLPLLEANPQFLGLDLTAAFDGCLWMRWCDLAEDAFKRDGQPATRVRVAQRVEAALRAALAERRAA